MAGPRSKDVLRNIVFAPPPPNMSVEYHRQTHMVAVGRFKHPAYLDGNTLRGTLDGRVLAHKLDNGNWSRPVKESVYHRAATDDILPDGPAVVVHLDKGQYY